MGAHRTIRRKKPLTYTQTKGLLRKEAIKLLHNELKSTESITSLTTPLSVYQNASSKGQDVHRGGDSSKILVKWLRASHPGPIKVLEVGCLEVDNAIAKFVEKNDGTIRRIDLKSRDPRIEEQDFMELDAPVEVVFIYIWLMIDVRYDFAFPGIEFCAYATGTICNAQKDDFFPTTFSTVAISGAICSASPAVYREFTVFD